MTIHWSLHHSLVTRALSGYCRTWTLHDVSSVGCPSCSAHLSAVEAPLFGNQTDSYYSLHHLAHPTVLIDQADHLDSISLCRKEAAGVISVPSPSNDQDNVVLNIYPPCHLSKKLLRTICPSISFSNGPRTPPSRPTMANDEHLMVIITDQD